VPNCTVDLSYPAFQKELQHLRKKYPKVVTDLAAHSARIEADYTDPKLHAVRVPMGIHGDSTFEVWKYDMGSSDLKRHPRECFRVLYICLDPTATPRKLSAFTIYWKGDRSDIRPAEIRKIVDDLQP
jgi:hypothetical protein